MSCCKFSPAAVRRLGTLLLTCAALLAAGCATTQSESNIPWNAPQSWEGTPALPGLSPM